MDGSFVSSDTVYQLSSVTANHTISASFKLMTVTITASAGANGAISPTSAVAVTYGANQVFTFDADTLYHVDSVFVDAVYVDSTVSYTFTNVTTTHTISVVFEVDPPVDNTTYRTFRASSELSTPKATKMKFKNGVLSSGTDPNMASVLENVFVRVGKAGATFLGVAQTDAAAAKKYAWIAYKKGSDLAKLFTTPHDGQSYPIDSLRKTGKKAKKLSKALKADRKTYNNPAFEQGVMFNLNLVASADSVTPKGFGDLLLDTTGVLAGRDMNGQSLTAVGRYLDSVMTYWDTLGVESTAAYNALGTFITTVIQPINERFYEALSVGVNSLIDTVGVTTGTGQPSNKKNVYAVTLLGAKTAAQVGIVKKNTSKSHTEPATIQPFGYIDTPEMYSLHQNYPNPFNPTTMLSFNLQSTSIVTLKIYNVLGQEVQTLFNNQEIEEGSHEVEFNASQLSSGIYFYKLTGVSIDESERGTAFSDVKKMILMK